MGPHPTSKLLSSDMLLCREMDLNGVAETTARAKHLQTFQLSQPVPELRFRSDCVMLNKVPLPGRGNSCSNKAMRPYIEPPSCNGCILQAPPILGIILHNKNDTLELGTSCATVTVTPCTSVEHEWLETDVSELIHSPSSRTNL